MDLGLPKKKGLWRVPGRAGVGISAPLSEVVEVRENGWNLRKKNEGRIRPENTVRKSAQISALGPPFLEEILGRVFCAYFSKIVIFGVF